MFQASTSKQTGAAKVSTVGSIAKGQAPFISFEGIDGAGKSTLINALTHWLQHENISVMCTREPGGTPGGEKIRTLLMEQSWCLKAEALLMFAQRAEHVECCIKPAITAGKWVLCDRFIDSSYAYQAAGRNMGEQAVAELEQWTLDGFLPDLTILLDIPIEESLTRRKKRQSQLNFNADDRFERELMSHYDTLRHAFLNRASANPHRILVFDATQTQQDLFFAVKQAIKSRYFSVESTVC
jgi:dTMP kinase